MKEPGWKCILMDIAWPERGGGKIKRGADRHYKVIPLKQIPDVVLSCPYWDPSDDSHLWMWVTNNYLEHGLRFMKLFGFRYITNAVWAKTRMGLGQYLRGRHELLLFGVRGRLPALTRKKSTLIGNALLPRTVHSRKPPESYELVEAVSPGPRLEMFARNTRPGWTSWGDQL